MSQQSQDMWNFPLINLSMKYKDWSKKWDIHFGIHGEILTAMTHQATSKWCFSANFLYSPFNSICVFTRTLIHCSFDAVWLSRVIKNFLLFCALKNLINRSLSAIILLWPQKLMIWFIYDQAGVDLYCFPRLYCLPSCHLSSMLPLFVKITTAKLIGPKLTQNFNF